MEEFACLETAYLSWFSRRVRSYLEDFSAGSVRMGGIVDSSYLPWRVLVYCGGKKTKNCEVDSIKRVKQDSYNRNPNNSSGLCAPHKHREAPLRCGESLRR
jgi:hypothetical protein